jgi:hypothetical protein
MFPGIRYYTDNYYNSTQPQADTMDGQGMDSQEVDAQEVDAQEVDSQQRELKFLECQQHGEEIEAFMQAVSPQAAGQPGLLTHWQNALDMSRSHMDMFFAAEAEQEKPAWWTDEIVNQHLQMIDSIRNFERKLRYLVHGGEIFPLPCGNYYGNKTKDLEATVTCGPFAHMVIARVLFVLQRKAQGCSSFPSDGSLRYDNPQFIIDVDRQNFLLPPWYKFLCYENRKTSLTLEWQAVIFFTGWLTWMEHRLVEKNVPALS